MNVEKHQACTYCGFKTALRSQEGEQLPACSVCVLTRDMDVKSSLARIANTILRELSEVRGLVRKLVEERESRVD